MNIHIYYYLTLPFIGMMAFFLIISVPYLYLKKIRYFCFFILSVILFSLSQNPSIHSWDKPITAMVFAGRFSALFFLWQFTKYLFYDNYTTKHWHWLLLLLKIILPFLFFSNNILNGIPLTSIGLLHPASLLLILINLFLLVHILYIISKEWRQDLINHRLRLRFIFFFGLSFMLILVILLRITLPESVQKWIPLLTQTYVLLFLFLLIPFLVKLQDDFLGELCDPAKNNCATNSDNTNHVLTELKSKRSKNNTKAQQLLPELILVIEQKKIYLEETLTISKLANLLNTEPYILRETIHSQLGFRNFNEFLNEYRLQHALELLQEQTYSQWPITRLAVESGFNSLSAFYRAYDSKKNAWNLPQHPKDYRLASKKKS